MWNDITKKKAPDDEEVLVYTEGGKMRVSTFHRGQWNTYLRVLAWDHLPSEPDFLEQQEPVVKRGRKKKDKA